MTWATGNTKKCCTFTMAWKCFRNISKVSGLIRYVHLPFLATLRSIKIAIFGNFWRALLLTKMQNIARNGKKVTEVLYRVTMCSHLLPFLATTVIWQIVAIFSNLVK